MTTFYLSSTYEDLKECREAVCKVLRQMGHQVEGMESYTADGRAPLEKCLADVARCDVYVGIFARRYGYVPGKNNPRHLSITELEYRTAVERKKKALIFILDKNAMWRDEDEGDEQRKRLRSLREELAKEHTVSFFHDRHELAAQVSVAVASLLKHDEQPDGRRPEPELEPEPEAQPGPTSQPPPPRPWKWYALAALGVALLGVVLLYQFKIRYWPDEYPTEKRYDFLLSERERLGKAWRLPDGAWDLERMEEDEDYAALLIKGSRMAMPADLGSKVFYDHHAEFKVRFTKGNKAAWVLRAQPDGESGYLFELRKEKTTLFLKGWVLSGGRLGDPLPGEKLLRYSKCCALTDALQVNADITDGADGTRIQYHIRLDSDIGHSTEDTAKSDEADFIDKDATFGWGSIGLLVTDGITEPATDGGVMRVEYVYLTPLRREAGGGPSNEKGAR
ncbi:MAG: DUF4062 domain-containing protein [Acidobacteria bacterium]|nr:DUF4062 domain-containing protein [Acidobacteriota bacterium]